ncbi:MAG: hypothetical protein DRP85_08405 [Candidatus Makaraimicrobium thalassicum]|nr:MAG: hypothetical protein DRP85_08405 [Candidatus Omnitrophota bacterium]
MVRDSGSRWLRAGAVWQAQAGAWLKQADQAGARSHFSVLLSGEDFHGFVEAAAFHQHEKVDGVAFHAPRGPDPVVRFDDEILFVFDQKIVVGFGPQAVAAVFQDGHQPAASGASDLLAAPVGFGVAALVGG